MVVSDNWESPNFQGVYWKGANPVSFREGSKICLCTFKHTHMILNTTPKSLILGNLEVGERWKVYLTWPSYRWVRRIEVDKCIAHSKKICVESKNNQFPNIHFWVSRVWRWKVYACTCRFSRLTDWTTPLSCIVKLRIVWWFVRSAGCGTGVRCPGEDWIFNFLGSTSGHFPILYIYIEKTYCLL